MDHLTSPAFMLSVQSNPYYFSGTLREMAQVIMDPTGKHRLTIRFVSAEGGSNFHSLVWAVFENSTWLDRVVIPRQEFQPPTKHRRWVTEAHSFDPETGHAIIKVAEGNAPVGTPVVNYTYSWKEWDLVQNRELRLLQVCESPFDHYEP